MEANGNVSTQCPVADGEITPSVSAASLGSPSTRYWLQCADQTQVVSAENQGGSTYYVLILCAYLSVLLGSCNVCKKMMKLIQWKSLAP